MQASSTTGIGSQCLPKPNKDVCFVCQKSPEPGEGLKRCQKCRAVPYCSRECQVVDWKNGHKELCPVYMVDGNMDYTSTILGQKGVKGKKAAREGLRTRGEIMNDLQIWANEHNGDTLTVTAWCAMDLLRNIKKAETHFFALTVRRNRAVTAARPRAMYTLVDAAVLPFAVLDAKFEAVANAVTGVRCHPVRDALAHDRAQRLADGGLGSVMVMTFELAPGEELTPQEAVEQMSVFVMQPLGLFKVHKQSLGRLPPTIRSVWKQCLKNALDGGAWSMSYQPYRG